MEYPQSQRVRIVESGSTDGENGKRWRPEQGEVLRDERGNAHHRHREHTGRALLVERECEHGSHGHGAHGAEYQAIKLACTGAD